MRARRLPARRHETQAPSAACKTTVEPARRAGRRDRYDVHALARPARTLRRDEATARARRGYTPDRGAERDHGTGRTRRRARSGRYRLLHGGRRALRSKAARRLNTARSLRSWQRGPKRCTIGPRYEKRVEHARSEERRVGKE